MTDKTAAFLRRLQRERDGWELMRSAARVAGDTAAERQASARLSAIAIIGGCIRENVYGEGRS